MKKILACLVVLFLLISWGYFKYRQIDKATRVLALQVQLTEFDSNFKDTVFSERPWERINTISVYQTARHADYLKAHGIKYKNMTVWNSVLHAENQVELVRETEAQIYGDDFHNAIEYMNAAMDSFKNDPRLKNTMICKVKDNICVEVYRFMLGE